MTELSRQTVTCTPGEYAWVSNNTVSVTTSTLPRGVCSRDKYLNVSGFSMQSVFVSSSDQRAATAPAVWILGYLVIIFYLYQSSQWKWIMEKETWKALLTGKRDLRWQLKLVIGMYSFYRSCDESQWSNYTRFIKLLIWCFTPIRIGAVRSRLLYDRQQKEREYVDDYAQDLRKLFYKAYPQTLQGTTDLENISKSILCNQFVAELPPDIKIKVYSWYWGNIDTLLVRLELNR